MTQKAEQLLNLIRENPDLPIVPMVDNDVVGYGNYGYWLGKWGEAEVTEYYLGEDEVHFRNEDEEIVLMDLKGCEFGSDPQGRDICDLSNEEWKALYESIPWTKCIAVYIWPEKGGQ